MNTESECGAPPQSTKLRRVTQQCWKEEGSTQKRAPAFIRGAKEHPYLLSASIMILLLVASAMLLPMMLFTPAYLQPRATGVLGTLMFRSSGQFNPDLTQGYNDTITLSLRSLLPPPVGMSYDAWLMPDPGDDATVPLLLGTLDAGPANLTYASPTHSNLLATYSGVRVTIQPSNSMPERPSQDPTSWKWEGFLPNLPTPGDENRYSFLSHVRHLLAKDSTLQANQIPGGLDLWLTRNVSKVEEWASAAQGDWHGSQTSNEEADQIHRHMLRILEYLDGMFYYTRDVPAGSPWLVDPLAGKIGLLSSVANQNPASLLAHVDIHLMGLAASPGHTEQQQQLAVSVDTVMNRMSTDLQRVRNEAASLAKLNTLQLKQPGNQTLLDDIALLSTEVKSGWLDASTGENRGGVLWMTSQLEQFTTISLSASR